MILSLSVNKITNKNVSENTTKIIETLESNSGKVDLVCFGETFLQGFDCLTWNFKTDKNIAVKQSSEPIRKIKRIAANFNIAVAFGYMELKNNKIFSSYLVISKKGKIICNYRRISKGWKEPIADNHYCEGNKTGFFKIKNNKFAIGLCGDLWNDGILADCTANKPAVLLWPVYLDYTPKKWENDKFEYVSRVAKYNCDTVLVNSFCDEPDLAKGGAIHIKNGRLVSELAAGKVGELIIEIV
ncbi:MAG TPA: nitrilase-related carbon-nitrogen hydrolase [Clostridia bacterium]|nr:nitrilase-related carbon-nitrogen hydrolase [Clostridia bacterium]